MIYINLEGRLGNNLWQIAAAATLAERLDEPFCAVPNRYYHCPEPDNCNFTDYILPFKETIFRNITFVDSVPQDCYYYEYEGDLNKITEMPATNVRIEGYFQDIRLVSEVLAQSLFSPTDDIIALLKGRYPILNRENTCAIVVRRGDYLHLPMPFPVEDMAYYRRCMRKLEKRLDTKDMHYLVISDDAEWCHRKFRGARFTIVDDEPPLYDLYLASLCQHNIISNGSFAVWGGLLNKNPNKYVYYPSPWLGVGMRRLDFTRTRTHTPLPTSWCRVKHYSRAYIYGVMLWLVNGIKKRIFCK